MWPQFWVWLITTIISIALAPKPPKPRRAALEDFELPIAEEDVPIPVVFGTMTITGPNVLWYGDLKSKAMKKSGITGSTVIGYKYHLGLQFGVCLGPVNALKKITIGGKSAWSGNQTASGSIAISQSSLFGGERREGGIVGTVDVLFGGPAQVANTYLAAAIGTTIPADRGILSAVFHNSAGDDGGYVGTTAYPKPWAWTVNRTTAGWDNDDPWYTAKSAIGADMNPAHILYECLTNPEWGMGIPRARLDDAAWRATADVLYTEGFGLSFLWAQADTIENFAQIVLDHIAGVLVFRLDTGVYELDLIRGGYTPGSLPLYDESNVLDVTSRQVNGWGETVNELTLSYTDPTTEKATAITANDLANAAFQGRVAESISLPGIRNATLAGQVVQRELANKSTPLAVLEIKVNRDAWSVRQGALFRFSWLAYDLTDIVLRVLQINKGTLDDGTITVHALEDIYSLGFGSYVVTPAAPTAPTETLDDLANEIVSNAITGIATAPPGSPTDGATYYIGTGATGAWAGKDGQLATWDADLAAWVYSTVAGRPVVYDTGTDTYVTLIGDGTTDLPPWSPTAPAIQAADLVITSNAAFQDTALAISLVPGTYAIEAFLEHIGNSTPQLVTRLTFGGTESQFAALRSTTLGTTAGFEQTAAQPYDATYADTGTGVTTYFGTIIVTAPGTLKFQARQGTSSATPVTISAGSWLRATKLA